MALHEQATELAKKIRAGDRGSVEFFYKMHVPVFWKTISGFARDEADARAMYNLGMLKILGNLASFDVSRPIWPWMKTVFTHVCIDEVRSRNRFLVKNELLFAQNQWIETEANDEIDADEIHELLKKLPETERTVLVLFAIEGFSHAEIGQKLDISAAVSRWHLFQARKHFKEFFYGKKGAPMQASLSHLT